ncbi:MAG: GcrA family cell cycle regulator [Hyphomicrobiaceae bacterium]
MATYANSLARSAWRWTVFVRCIIIYVASQCVNLYFLKKLIHSHMNTRAGTMRNKTNKNKSLLELEANECRWPIGDPRKPGFHFCGAKQMAGRPYCIEHWALSFVPGRSRHGGQQAKAPLPIVQIANKKAA